MSALVLIRFLDAISIGCSLAGLAVTVLAVRDILLDLDAARMVAGRQATSPMAKLLERQNRLSTDIGISAAVSGAILHLALLSLGLIALTAPAPRPGREVFGVVYALAFITMQATSVAVQVRVLRKRHELRESSGDSSSDQ